MKRLWFICLFLCLMISEGWSQSWTVQFTSGRDQYQLQTQQINGVDYASISDVALIFRATKVWYGDVGKLILKLEGHKIRLTFDSPIVVIDEQSKVKLMHPIQMVAGDMFVPLEFIHTVIAEITDSSVKELRAERQLILGPKTITISGINFEVTSEKTTILLQITEPAPYSIDTAHSGRVILTINGGVVDAGRISTDTAHGLVSRVLAYQTKDLAQIAFEVSSEAKRFKAYDQEDPAMIILEITTLDDKPSPPPSLPTYRDNGTGQGFNQDDFGLIVIDAGHGGKDPGAVGANGTLEKEITLEIAKRLKDMIESRTNMAVMLTRYDDTFIKLRRRTEIANNAKADLFVSIHCNASHDRRARGTETYFLSRAKNDAAKATELRENKVIEFEVPEHGKPPADILELMLWDMVANEYHRESSLLAERVQDALSEKLNLRSRGGKQAGFYVLMGAAMPAILVEAAFISNPNEELKLKTPQFQKKIAEGIYDGIVEFISVYKQVH